MRHSKLFAIACLICLNLTAPARADPPVIEDAQLRGTRLDVTVSHPDSGWDHYADLWQVFDANGVMIGERVLLHPHETEQPFTRSLALSTTPTGASLTIVASCTNGDKSDPFLLTLSN